MFLWSRVAAVLASTGCVLQVATAIERTLVSSPQHWTICCTSQSKINDTRLYRCWIGLLPLKTQDRAASEARFDEYQPSWMCCSMT